jgi:hypothetical protein
MMNLWNCLEDFGSFCARIARGDRGRRGPSIYQPAGEGLPFPSDAGLGSALGKKCEQAGSAIFFDRAQEWPYGYHGRGGLLDTGGVSCGGAIPARGPLRPLIRAARSPGENVAELWREVVAVTGEGLSLDGAPFGATAVAAHELPRLAERGNGMEQVFEPMPAMQAGGQWRGWLGHRRQGQGLNTTVTRPGPMCRVLSFPVSASASVWLTPER